MRVSSPAVRKTAAAVLADARVLVMHNTGEFTRIPLGAFPWYIFLTLFAPPSLLNAVVRCFGKTVFR